MGGVEMIVWFWRGGLGVDVRCWNFWSLEYGYWYFDIE